MHAAYMQAQANQAQGQEGMKVPSRPTTASGFAQPHQQGGQNAAMLGPSGGQQAAKSPSGYPPIAPAPTAPGSPVRGAKRKVGGTPVPGGQPGQQHGQGPQAQQQQQLGQPHSQQYVQQAQMQHQQENLSAPVPPQTPRLSMSTPSMPNAGASANGTPTSAGPQTGLTGMGIAGNVGQSTSSSNALMNMGMGLMGGAGGGMMGPPVLPRTASQAGEMGMSIGVNGRQMSGGPMAGAMGRASPIQTMNAGVGLGVSMDMATPHTPVRQGSQPPAPVTPPFAHTGTPAANAGAGGMFDAPGLERKPSVQEGAGASTADSTHSRSVSNGAPASTPATNGVSVAAPPPPTIIPQLPPLNVQLNPKISRVAIVPLVESATKIPPLTPEEIANVKKWMEVDKEYDGRYKAMKEKMTVEMRETVGKPKAWWEKDSVMEEGRVPMPSHRGPGTKRPEKWSLTGLKQSKEKEIKDKKRAGKREGFKPPRRLKPEDANRPEQLVPIRLEFDVDHHKMRDTFVWNLNDPVITPEIFAQSVVEDYNLPPSYHSVITKVIQDQLSDYKAHSATFGEDGVFVSSDTEDIQSGAFDDEEAEWWESWRKTTYAVAKRRKLVKEEVVDTPTLATVSSTEVPMSVDDFDEDEDSMQEELRILIKLDVVVGSVKLEDQFEWNLENGDPTPEQFADIYCRDLGLGGEFKTAIAHAIREQVQIYQKSLFLVGHPSDGSAVQDDDLRMSLLPSLTTGARAIDQVSAFTPILNYLSDSEIERNEKEREKELNRRRRKTTRGRRGVALPDREPPKTFRTPAIGFPEVDAATLAAVTAAAAPTSRRAAAAAASHNIANMIASENGTVVLPSAQPTPLAPIAHSAPKEKKPKGLFKAPSFPSSVLRPRVNLRGAITSTAADPSTFPPPIEGDQPLPSSSAGADSKGARVVLSAKRTKELEREAKEKEYADGQHANMINGVWHCSNCGCPESIAVGRRKGPLGDKSQCGTCGKFWHRHRRPRPVEYNADEEYHRNLLREAEQARIAAKRRRPPPSQVDDQSSKAAPEDGDAEPETPKIATERGPCGASIVSLCSKGDVPDVNRIERVGVAACPARDQINWGSVGASGALCIRE
ncbi:hypothetical protein EVJ58_g7775 [Rhodofomes roseus]|uniref:SNF5-domain-containing protein n=1 Tax=Rhodofomes roseus TaxID=34475 RepID=A0A4Y9Y5W6_9APHY|nr:hypothetical protein EVJ58_g7775 [Rhodofomes roseus]